MYTNIILKKELKGGTDKMNAEYFTEAAGSFIACVTVFTIFLNFLLLAAEELKKCSIIKRKKKNYAVVRPSGRMVLQGPDRVMGA